MWKASLVEPDAGDLGVDLRPAAAGAGRRFEDEHRAPLAHDEPVAAAVERPRGGGGGVVPLGQGAEVAEPGHPHRRDRAVAGAGEADVDPAALDPPPRLRQRDVAAGARGGHRRRRAA